MMKNNNKKKANTAKKLLPAAMMLAVSASMLGTSTYAWFTMNKEVTVTGMQMRTTVGSNLLISETNADASSYRNDLNQLRACTLEPSSTIDGINYYWTSTSNVDAAGDALSNSYTLYEENDGDNWNHTIAAKDLYDAGFNTNYGFTEPAATYEGVSYGYVDYTFYLKAVNTEATAQNIKLTKLNFLYNGAAPQDGDPSTEVTDKAWRVALIAKTASLGSDPGAIAASDVVSIFTIDGAQNFEFTAANGDTPRKEKAIGGTSNAAASLSYGDSKDSYNVAGEWGNIASGAEAYYKVVVRLWLEGEDTTCTNQTYALLKSDYTLDLKFEFDPNASAVDNINDSAAAPNATISNSSGTLTATLSTGTPSGYQWYNRSGRTAVASATNATFTPGTSGTYYCIITDSLGNTYRTPDAVVTVN
jgi:hypothetical protein